MFYRQKNKSLIDSANKYHVKGYLVFRTAKDSVFKWLLPKGFGHVFAVIERPDHKILIDSTISHSVARIYPNGYNCQLEEDDTVLKFDRMIDITHKNSHFGFMSCVEVIKRFLGLTEYFIFTPHQLYRTLK